jgi:ornithine cyclodeaminase/alanine dehydrogenase-like protein (mu-crystallin family)
MLILSQSDVRQLLPMRDCIGVMEEALAGLARGEAMLPLRSIIKLPDPLGFFAMMPAFTASPASIGVKVLTVFPGNHGSAFDSHQGAVLLFEAKHGSLQAILDATAITGIRTAAVSAVATKLLARKNARSLAILGSGVQARMHIEAIPLVRDIDVVRIWSRNPDNAEALARETKEKFGIATEVFPTAEAAVRDSDIVCTVTLSHQPVLHGAWLKPGAHVNAVGTATPNAREVDTDTVKRSRLYVDRRESGLKEPGDILIPINEGAITADHLVGEIGEILIGKTPARGSENEITLFKSLGLAIEDLAAARFVAERAAATGAGVKVELGGMR